jgi:hypothetical protein
MILMLSALNKTSVKRELEISIYESGLLKISNPIPNKILILKDKGTFFVRNDKAIAKKGTDKQAME